MNSEIPDFMTMTKSERSKWIKAADKRKDFDSMRLAGKKYIQKIQQLIQEKKAAQHD